MVIPNLYLETMVHHSDSRNRYLKNKNENENEEEKEEGTRINGSFFIIFQIINKETQYSIIYKCWTSESKYLHT